MSITRHPISVKYILILSGQTIKCVPIGNNKRYTAVCKLSNLANWAQTVVNEKEIIVLERSISVDERSNSSSPEQFTASALSECEKGGTDWSSLSSGH
jgi:hypothetical protein